MLSEADRATVDAIVGQAMAAQGQPGVIVDITGPRGDYRTAYGTTHVKGGLVNSVARLFGAGRSPRPLTPQDRVRMGSITKMFTAVAAFQQIDAGKVRLDDRLKQFVTGIPNGDKITVEHLLMMRSGVYDYVKHYGVQLRLSAFPTMFYSDDMAVGLMRTHKSEFEPGSRFAYCNSNAILVGRIVEKVTGRPIAEVINTDICHRIGLHHTQWPVVDELPEPAASDERIHPELAGAAGTLITTVADLTRFLKALVGGELLSPESTALMLNDFWGVYPMPSEWHPLSVLGYGHFTVRHGAWIGHNGRIGGFNSVALIHPITGASIVVVGNNGPHNGAHLIGNRIADALYPGSMSTPVFSRGLSD